MRLVFLLWGPTPAVLVIYGASPRWTRPQVVWTPAAETAILIAARFSASLWHPSQKAVFYSRPTPQTNLVPHNVGGVVELKTLVFFLLLLKKKITSIKIKKTTDHRGRYYCKPYESVGRNGTVEIATRCILRETSLFQEKEREKKMKFWPSILAGGGGSGQALFFWFG